MFEKLKALFSNLGLFVKYGDTIRTITTAWRSFPGLANSEDVRNWLRPLLVDISLLTTLTKTPIDDAIANAAVRILDSNRAWGVVYSMALLLVEDTGKMLHSPWIPEPDEIDAVALRKAKAARFRLCDDTANSLGTVIREAIPESPHLAIGAIGLILYLLQRFYNR